MNSITKNLNPESIVATAKMLRSAKKEIILLVEGDNDIALFSHALGLPRSNFISCFGKERLMRVFDLSPRKGLDGGTIFLRDSDCDAVQNQERDGVLLLTSDNYDFEMSLLPKRVFGRIFAEFVKTKASPEFIEGAFKKLIETSAFVGALRLVSHTDKLNLDFDEAKFNFINQRDISIDIEEMIRYFFARSRLSIIGVEEISERVRSIAADTSRQSKISCGKDFLKILSAALSRHYRCCNATECTFETLARMFRMTVTQDDIKTQSLYPLLVKQVQKSGMTWTGFPL